MDPLNHAHLRDLKNDAQRSCEHKQTHGAVIYPRGIEQGAVSYENGGISIIKGQTIFMLSNRNNFLLMATIINGINLKRDYFLLET